MEPQGTLRNSKSLKSFTIKPPLQNCPPPSPLPQSALEREAKAIRAQKDYPNIKVCTFHSFIDEPKTYAH